MVHITVNFNDTIKNATTVDSFTSMLMYANVWYKTDSLKAGLLYATGDYDKDATTKMGTTVGYTMGEDWAFGTLIYDFLCGMNTLTTVTTPASPTPTALAAYNVQNLYGQYTVNENLSVDVAYRMGASSVSEDDQKYSEMDFGLSYVLTDALTASLGYATGSIDLGAGAESATKMFWGMTASY